MKRLIISILSLLSLAIGTQASLPEIVPPVGAEGEEGNAVAVPKGAFAPVAEAVAHGDRSGDGLG